MIKPTGIAGVRPWVRGAFVATLLLLPGVFSWGSEPAERLVRATYKLSNAESTATGLVVEHEAADGARERYLVTAKHVFEDMEGGTFQLVGRELQGDGTWHRREHRIRIRDGGDNLWDAHPEQDLAVLLLPADLELEAVPSRCLATPESLQSVHTGDAVRLVVFPERSEANGAGFPYCRRGAIAGYPILPYGPHPVFVVDTTTWPGDSGGPVMLEGIEAPGGGPLIIGVVQGMRRITDHSQESRFVERLTHYPLGISEVVHAVFLRELIQE